MKPHYLLSSLLLCCACVLAQTPAAPTTVASPDGRLQIGFAAGPNLTWQVSFKGRPVIEPSQLGLELQGQGPLGPNMRVVSAKPSSGDETYRMPHGKSNPVHNRYNALLVVLEENTRLRRVLHLEARAYDDGVAFRYHVPAQNSIRELRLARERTQFTLSKDGTTYPLVLSSYRTSYEDNYHKAPVSSLKPDWLVALPFLADLPGTAWVAITEAHLENYAGLYLGRTNQARTLEARLAPRADHPEIAVTGQTPLSSPWRVVMVADDPGRLVESNLVPNLNPPSAIADTSWIKPGRAAWPWWSGEVAKGVPNAGMNTASINYYVDFAAEAGLEYVLIDEGWSQGIRGGEGDLTRTAPAVDMPAVMKYAASKKVGIWLWAHWSLVDRQMEDAFATFARWGAAGVKIDFMDRDDQWMVDFYHRALRTAAAYKLMIDFHGAYKPDGMRRAWPNLMTSEGVLGLEYTKWSGRVTPEHNLVLPFTRMLAGPLDYTPGGFLNVTRAAFTPRRTEPLVMGTRAHHLASMVVYESPFLCFADHPDAYRGQQGYEFIRKVPATWDETRVLHASVGEYITVARRRGSEWYIGSMTVAGRELDIPLSFLAAGKYVAEIYADATDADIDPAKATREERPVERGARLRVKLAADGGNAIRIRPM